MKLPLDTECIICTCIIKELANPDGCNHDFCKSCLIEWSQRSSKCPMCKNIFVYEKGIKKQIPLSEIKNKNDKDDNEDNNESEDESNIDEGCYICGKKKTSVLNTDTVEFLIDKNKNKIICEKCANKNKNKIQTISIRW